MRRPQVMAEGCDRMTRVKLCGMSRPEDMAAANVCRPDMIGFVFWEKSKRCVTRPQAAALRALLDPEIMAVGVFVDEAPEKVAALLNDGIIDMAQLHGQEDEAYIAALRALTDKPLMKAFVIHGPEDVAAAARSSADLVLVDSGKGSGRSFNWQLLAGLLRPYFLAGGLDPDCVGSALAALAPYGVDVSSGIETEGRKDLEKMRRFTRQVRTAG